jgi:NADP-dependent aldehyde dehydrogenase
VFAVDDATTRAFVEELAKQISAVPAATMLNAAIAKGYAAGQARLTAKARRVTPAAGAPAGAAALGVPAVFATTAEDFLANHALAEEVFGPTTLVILAKDAGQLEQLAARLDGQLTASIHAGAGEVEQFGPLVDALQRRAGRLVFNGFSPGVEVNSSMQHGGPYPATSDGRTTSVGTAAIQRFARPVAYQDWPDAALPLEVREGNPRKIVRTVDGVSTLAT